ncbi:hypothetical protein Tco_0792720 [Tanacetum coccineum]
MVNSGLVKAIDSLVSLGEHFATFRVWGILETDIQEQDKKKAKNKQSRARNGKDKVKPKPKSFNHESELLHNRFLRCLDVAAMKSLYLYVLNGIAMFLGWLENDISFLPMGKKMVKQVKITLGILEAGNEKN